jgi:LysM repeat protein
MSPRCTHLAGPCGRWFALAALSLVAPSVMAAELTVSAEQQARAQQVAATGVPLEALAPDAPESHTVQRGDTLWAIAKLFLKSPWRWPELWGMNLQQVRNPHLIYPGQVLVLVRNGGTAQLRVAQEVTAQGQAPTNTVVLSPRVRSQVLDSGAIASIPLNLIGPFLNESVVLTEDELAQAPRIVATQEDRVMLSRGEIAYVRGDLGTARSFTLFREAKPLRDPDTREVLGYEAGYVGTVEFVRAAGSRPAPDGKRELAVPATFVLTTVRQEAGVGDRLAPLPPRDSSAFVPHPPAQPMNGRIVSIYGEALNAGQNQIVALNRGRQQGLEAGHVLALWSDGALTTDPTVRGREEPIKLPDEPLGLLFVFRVFDRVSYALVLSAVDAVRAGDRFTQP